MAKRRITGSLQVRTYDVLHRAIEEGIDYGWHRARKHTDEPSEETIKSEIMCAVLNSILEVFKCEDEA